MRARPGAHFRPTGTGVHANCRACTTSDMAAACKVCAHARACTGACTGVRACMPPGKPAQLLAWLLGGCVHPAWPHARAVDPCSQPSHRSTHPRSRHVAPASTPSSPLGCLAARVHRRRLRLRGVQARSAVTMHVHRMPPCTHDERARTMLPTPRMSVGSNGHPAPRCWHRSVERVSMHGMHGCRRTCCSLRDASVESRRW
jgi:hypothetical protein